MTDFMPLFIFSNTLQTPLNILQKPLKHPSTPFQTPFKIISFFAHKMDGKKKGDRGGSPFFEVISQKNL